MDWTVYVEIETEGPIDEAALWALAELGGSATGAAGDRRLSAITTETAPDGARALTQALDRVRAVIPVTLVAAEITTTAEADRRLAEPAFPALVGITEIASLLGVSRQRASALQANPSFPVPVASLASGPIWRRRDLTRFEETWSRQPGRPASTKPA